MADYHRDSYEWFEWKRHAAARGRCREGHGRRTAQEEGTPCLHAVARASPSSRSRSTSSTATLTRDEVKTDDAQVDADVVPVATRVGGVVLQMQVHDNEKVEAGQVIAEIDDADYKAKVAAAAGRPRRRDRAGRGRPTRRSTS